MVIRTRENGRAEKKLLLHDHSWHPDILINLRGPSSYQWWKASRLLCNRQYFLSGTCGFRETGHFHLFYLHPGKQAKAESGLK